MKAFYTIICLLASTALYACPFCNSQTAKEIKTYLFGPDLLFNLLITMLVRTELEKLKLHLVNIALGEVVIEEKDRLRTSYTNCQMH